MAGHLFVVRGDITRLACDGWLLPCDAGVRVTDGWLEVAPEPARVLLERDRARSVVPAGWGDHGLRAFRLEAWGSNNEPRVWLVNTGADANRDVGWYLEGVSEFVRLASADLRDRPRSKSSALRGRPRPLLALPLVGTGAGGQAASKGELVKALVKSLREGAEGANADVALVTRHPADFAAVQTHRAAAAAPLGQLGQPLRDEVKKLSKAAAAGELVVFIGAGVSAGAGLPMWKELLDRLAESARIPADERVRLEQVNDLDRARIIELRLGQDPEPG